MNRFYVERRPVEERLIEEMIGNHPAVDRSTAYSYSWTSRIKMYDLDELEIRITHEDGRSYAWTIVHDWNTNIQALTIEAIGALLWRFHRPKFRIKSWR